MTTKKSANRPTHRIYAVVNSEKSEKASWTPIGAAWPHKDGKGFNLKLDLIPLNGASLVVRAIDAEQAEQPEGDGGAQ